MTTPGHYFPRILLAAVLLASIGATSLWAQEKKVSLSFGPPQDFSYEALRERARTMATQLYIAPAKPKPEVVRMLDYAAHGAIRFKDELALFTDRPDAYPVSFFHLGRLFPRKVTINLVEAGEAREILYSPDYFSMPADSPAHKLGHDSGFAGFRFQERHHEAGKRPADWLAFLGASYFRAVDESGQYGLSARGIAVNTAAPERKEEFPDFREFWIETPRAGDPVQTVYALLDGPSLTGAYKFTLRHETGAIIDVEKHLYLRKDIEQLGIAPLTSMFWFSEANRPAFLDWRPEVHDSDGLQLLTGGSEQIWRPLNNPPRVVTSSFFDMNPRGFGLMQRDRDFDHYLDGVHYEKRPSLWIEPAGDWGKGEAQLVEIPTDDEYHDNIVAMWKPDGPAKRGSSFSYNYRMHWRADDPLKSDIGRVVATRLGRSFKIEDAYPKNQWKFVVEFMGDRLIGLAPGIKPEAVISASRGSLVGSAVTGMIDDNRLGHWYVQFNLNVEGTEPVELRAFLKQGDTVLTETWLYQFHPPR